VEINVFQINRVKALYDRDIRLCRATLPIMYESLRSAVSGESLQGYSKFKKIRVGKFRFIYTLQDEILLIAIIEKRETVYQTFEHLYKNSNFLDM
jgi:mRNA-degrading endonuclease RelE of RelBE toxin-antitoxin system